MGGLGGTPAVADVIADLAAVPLANLSIGDLLKIALDVEGFAAREAAIRDYLQQQNDARAAIYEAQAEQIRREQELSAREAVVAERVARCDALDADLKRREAALAEHTRELSEDVRRREEALGQGQRELADDQKAWQDERAKAHANLDQELAEKRSAAERVGFEMRRTAQNDVNALRERAEQEIATTRIEMRDSAKARDAEIADRLARVVAQELALQERLSQLRAVLPAA
jgi:chromosome segregation ATPase